MPCLLHMSCRTCSLLAPCSSACMGATCLAFWAVVSVSACTVQIWDRDWAEAWLWTLASGKLALLPLYEDPHDDEMSEVDGWENPNREGVQVLTLHSSTGLACSSIVAQLLACVHTSFDVPCLLLALTLLCPMVPKLSLGFTFCLGSPV